MENKQDMLSDRVSISFLEPQQLMDLFNLTPNDVALLAANRMQLFPRFGAVAEETVMQINRFNGFSAFFEDAFSTESFTKKIRDFMRDYFEGACDAEHVSSRDKLGRLFFRFDIYPKDFLPFLAFLQERSEVEIKNVFGTTDLSFKLYKSLERYFRMDVAIIVDAFRSAEALKEKKEERRQQRYVDALERKMSQMTASLEEVSQKDMLTGLYNQRGFYDNIYREMANAKRQKWSLSLVFFDLNSFTSFNEEQGRRAGDRLLNVMASALVETFRESDIACRYGADDFCVILPDTNAKDARLVCKRLIERFRKTNLYGVAFCIGVAQTGPLQYSSPDELLDLAVRNMNEARKSLKNPKEFLLKG